MAEELSPTKRIAKNTLMLYIRMFISMIIGLYTSRVVLNTLGVEDYGIYGVVGGVVSMLGFLNASMSGATSRFITFELGRKDEQRLKDTFSSALIIHIGIALVVLIIAETAGLWFLNNKLVIPAERMGAAHWVFQCSILSAMLSITQVPYNACIIAHEKMGVYAYIEILNVSLKLLIVYLLTIGDFDKLKLYAVLTLAVSVVIIIMYRIYSIRNFREARFRWTWNKEIMRPMLSFSGFSLYAHMSYSFRQYSANIILNLIFGIIINAAVGIANTINGIVSLFSNNILTAFRPQIIKNYSNNNITTTNKLIIDASKYSTILILIIIIPCISETTKLIELWLGTVPQYSVTFTQLSLLSLITSISSPIYIGLCATEKIKKYSFIQGTLYLICPLIIYILCKNFLNPYISYYVIILIQLITQIVLIYEYKQRIYSFSIISYLKMVFKNILIPLLILIPIIILIQENVYIAITRLVFIFVVTIIAYALNTYIFMCKNEKIVIISKIKHLFNVFN